jgi:hypothetical protein
MYVCICVCVCVCVCLYTKQGEEPEVVQCIVENPGVISVQ